MPTEDRPGQSDAEERLNLARRHRDAARAEYQRNPTKENEDYAIRMETEVTAAQATVGGDDTDRDVDRKPVSSTGEGTATPETAPVTTQTEEAPEGTDTAPAADTDAVSFIYSDVNMHYILDKRHFPIRTVDHLLHVFFLETYKSVEAWQKQIVDAADTGAGEETPDTRFSDFTIKVLRKAGGDATKEEISYTVTAPAEFENNDEDKLVDSVLWVYTAFKEGVSALNSAATATSGEILPVVSAGDAEGGFLFPVFVVDPTKNELTPMTNIKYFSMAYNPVVNFIDMTFWSNYRTTDKGTVTSHPFTRQRDLRNVGRALMFTTGWYDRAKIIYDGRTYYRNIFVFSQPKQILTPGIGGEFDVDRLEPVVDSVPMGMKFVEFSA